MRDGLALHLLEMVFDLLGVGGNRKLGLLEGVLPRRLEGGQLVPAHLEDLGQVLLLLPGLVLLVLLCHVLPLLFSDYLWISRI